MMDQYRDGNAVLAETAFALRDYRGEYGHYPKDLSELVPKCLPVLPKDPFSDGPLRYRSTGDRCILYSVWQDGLDDTASKPFAVAFSEVSASIRSGDDRQHVSDDWGFGMAEPSELEMIEKEIQAEKNR
jgi:hypothetical protein